MPAGQHARFEPGHVEFLGDDVAIMHAYVSATDAAGAPVDVGHAMIELYVFARARRATGRSSRGRTRWRPERRRTGDWTFAARSGRVAR